jgi:NAD(P)-dependent dehydrogenase (short-subunit alcohol dehydrogenase family)
MNLELQNRVAVVTGASKGIGLAVTRALLEEGARVVATSRRSTPELDELSGELVHVPADLMDPGAPAEVVAQAVERFGRVDVLVNNAGGPPPGATLPRFGFLGLSDDDWRDMLEFTSSRPYGPAARRCRCSSRRAARSSTCPRPTGASPRPSTSITAPPRPR